MLGHWLEAGRFTSLTSSRQPYFSARTMRGARWPLTIATAPARRAPRPQLQRSRSRSPCACRVATGTNARGEGGPATGTCRPSPYALGSDLLLGKRCHTLEHLLSFFYCEHPLSTQRDQITRVPDQTTKRLRREDGGISPHYGPATRHSHSAGCCWWPSSCS